MSHDLVRYFVLLVTAYHQVSYSAYLVSLQVYGQGYGLGQGNDQSTCQGPGQGSKTMSRDCALASDLVQASSTLGKALKHMLAKHRPRRRCARVSFLKDACYEFTNYLLGFSEKDSNSRSAFTFSLFNIIHVYIFCLLDTAFCLRER